MNSITLNTPEKQHPVLDYEACAKVYAVTAEKLDYQTVGSPFHIYSSETIRKRLEFGGYPSLLPTDVFVWGEGEPEKPYLTKLGGVPYLPKDIAWPRDVEELPCIFVAQICFVDSKDAVAVPVPGDVLLMFAKHDGLGDSYLLCCEPGDLHFEWIRISDQPTWDRQDMEENGFRSALPPYFGVIHRMRDYQQSAEGEKTLILDAETDLAVSGTKIGGIPAYIQYGPPPYGDDAWKYHMEARTWDDAAYIAQFVSLQLSANTPFPLCNRKKPFGDDFRKDDSAWATGRTLMVGDVGSIYLYMKPDGTIVWFAESY